MVNSLGLGTTRLLTALLLARGMLVPSIQSGPPDDLLGRSGATSDRESE